MAMETESLDDPRRASGYSCEQSHHDHRSFPGASLPSEEDHFYSDLVKLRQRQGANGVRLGNRVGPALRRLCSIAEADEEAVVARKLATTLRSIAETVPGDRRDIALTALGLREGYEQRTYIERIEAAAYAAGRDARTYRRWSDESLRLMARRAVEALLEHIEGPRGGRRPGRWRTESLRCSLSLEHAVPEVVETRTVVAVEDALDELDLALSVPTALAQAVRPGAERLSVDVFEGGTVVERVAETNDRVGLALRLPRPLGTGDRHTVVLRYRAELQYPHYVCTPRYPCDQFHVSVRFGDRRPSAVFRLNGTLQDDARETRPGGLEIAVDKAGEVHADFEDLAPGFAYGVRWLWP
jgi:hypothetical protein